MTCLMCRSFVLAVVLCAGSLSAAAKADNPSGPFSIVSILRDPNALARPHDVEVHGSLMAVPGKGGTVAIMDVGNPTRPKVAWSTRREGDDAQTVLIQGKHVFVGGRDFLSLDIGKPREPRVCKRLHDRPRIDTINGMIVWGDHILYANKRGWIGAIDVSNPAEPTLAGALDTRTRGNIVSPHDIARYGWNHVVIVDQRDQSPLKVRLYRVSDAKHAVWTPGELLPVDKWRPEGAVGGDRLNGANRVAVRGHHAFVACNKANTLAVIDLGNVAEPKTVCVLDLDGEPSGMGLKGEVVFVGAGQTIHAFDVSNPRRPIELAAYKSTKVFPTAYAKVGGKKRYTTKNGVRTVCRGNAHDLVCCHGHLFVTAQSDDQVAILRIEDPKIRRLADQLPRRFSGLCRPVKVANATTMTRHRRVRPQALVIDGGGRLHRLLYTTDGSGGVSIATATATPLCEGAAWIDGKCNPVLNRIESAWQGNRAFVTALTRDADNDRWVMATVGNDATDSTPGIRAAGLWFSDDCLRWKQYEGNPVITVETDDAVNNAELFPGPDDPPVGMYVRDFRKLDGTWHALVQWRGAGTWSRMTVMRSDGDIAGPWKLRNLCLAPKDASPWFKRNRNLNWCQPVQVDGRWYAACQNGVAKTDRDNDHVGIVWSDDYLHWHELDNPVTPPLTRPDGSPVVSSQQFLLPPFLDESWRILLGARGVHGDKFMYIVYPEF